MPTSFYQTYPVIGKVIERLQPRRVLDMGIGWGKYGLLVRELVARSQDRVGIEAWEPYITDMQRAIYTDIRIGDFRTMPLEQESWDLILMIDVIEHVTKEDGHRLLQTLRGPILVSTPIEDIRQSLDNPFEEHISHWTLDDFKDYHFENLSNDLSTVVLING